MKKIFVLGDSISMHYGPFLETDLRGMLEYSRKTDAGAAQQNLDKPQGANGGDSARVLAFLRESGDIAADWVLVNCGLHDIKTNPVTGAKQVPLEQYRENLRAIAALVRSKLIWIRSTPCDENVHNSRPKMEFHRYSADIIAYNQAADEIMTAAGVPIIDLYTFTLNLGPDLYCDHVHFKEPIREKQAAFIAGWLAAGTRAG